MNQFQDSYEQTTKSSGFSSFSSLLSANETPITKNSRSTSMPSIYMVTRLSTDSGDISLESQLELEKIKRQPKLFNEKENSSTSDPSNNRQSSLEIDGIYPDNKSNIRQQRFPSTDFLNNNEDQHRIQRNRRALNNGLPEQKTQLGKIYSYFHW